MDRRILAGVLGVVLVVFSLFLLAKHTMEMSKHEKPPVVEKAQAKEGPPPKPEIVVKKVCVSCKGAGEIVCPACEGKRLIEVKCCKCKGYGYLICATCRGKNPLRCRRCGRDGRVACSHCRGTGQQRLPVRLNCAKCKRTGYIRCPKCQGTGEVLINR